MRTVTVTSLPAYLRGGELPGSSAERVMAFRRVDALHKPNPRSNAAVEHRDGVPVRDTDNGRDEAGFTGLRAQRRQGEHVADCQDAG